MTQIRAKLVTALVEIYYRGRLNRPSATGFPGGWDGMRTGKVWMPFQPPGKPNAKTSGLRSCEKFWSPLGM